jgi:hypothetical protein
MSYGRDAQLCDFRVCRMNPGGSGKNPDTPEGPESPGFPTPEFPGFIPKTLIHNVAQIDHPNSEIK